MEITNNRKTRAHERYNQIKIITFIEKIKKVLKVRRASSGEKPFPLNIVWPAYIFAHLRVLT